MELRYGKPEEVGMLPERVNHLENTMADWVKTGVSPTIVTLAARKGVIVSHKAYGIQGPEEGALPVELDTLYPLASISKPITATCLMMLMERGLVDLNRPVTSYIPEFTGEGKQAVMLHHLLTHTTGLTDEDIRNNVKEKKGKIEIPLAEATQHPGIHEGLYLGYDTPLRNAPGKIMSYCNYGYQLIGEIVRRISGKSLSDFAEENIFKPLGMKDTHYIVPEEKFSRVVRRKPINPEQTTDWFSTPYAMTCPSAPGGVYSTVMDLAIFGQMFLNKGKYGGKRLLSPVTIYEMTRNQIPGVAAKYEQEVFDEACWGYGWNVRGHKKDTCGTLRSAISINHGGAGGVSMWVDPVYETVLVYFSVEAKQNIDLFNNMVLASIDN